MSNPFGGKGGSSTTTENVLNPATQRQVERGYAAGNDVWNAYRQASQNWQHPGMNQFLRQAGGLAQNFGNISPYSQEALGLSRGLAGNMDFGTQFGLGGIDQYLNPAREQIIGGVQGAYDRLRTQASMGTGQEATLAGAFGGNRQAVLEAQRLGQLDQNEAQQIGQIEGQMFDTAAQRLMGDQAAARQLGLAGIGGIQGAGQEALQRQGAQQGMLSSMGDYIRNMQMQQQLMPLQLRSQGLQGLMGSLQGPYGSTTTQTEQSGGNPFLGALGGLATIGGTFSNPAGWLMGAGALGGFLGGM